MHAEDESDPFEAEVLHLMEWVEGSAACMIDKPTAFDAVDQTIELDLVSVLEFAADQTQFAVHLRRACLSVGTRQQTQLARDRQEGREPLLLLLVESLEAQGRNVDVHFTDMAVFCHRIDVAVVELEVDHFVVDFDLVDLRLHEFHQVRVQHNVLELVGLVDEPQSVSELSDTSQSVLALA